MNGNSFASSLAAVNRRSFTIVELLVVLSVMAMLAAMMMPALSQATERARASKCESNRRQYELAERMYEADWHYTPSDELETLLRTKYLNTSKLMECPSNGVYLWIGDRGKDIDPKMGCSIHEYPVDSESASGDGEAAEPAPTPKPPVPTPQPPTPKPKPDPKPRPAPKPGWGFMDPLSTLILLGFSLLFWRATPQIPRKRRRA